MNATNGVFEYRGVFRELLVALRSTIVTVIILGVGYPFVVSLCASAFFPYQATGSLVIVNGRVVGSALVGQAFTRDRYFHGRLSAAGKGYDPTQTGGSDLGPTSRKLIEATRLAIGSERLANPTMRVAPPIDLVTSSASGIDPDISPAAALYQVSRVARARRCSPSALRALIFAHIQTRQLGILGEPRVNVLALNRALDAR